MSDLLARLERLEARFAPPPPIEWMWETLGELHAVLVPGQVPTMPVNASARPDLSHAIDASSKSRPPDPRDRERPAEPGHSGPVTVGPFGTFREGDKPVPHAANRRR